MNLITKRLVVVVLCLAILWPLGAALAKRRPRSPRAVGISYLSDLERRIYRLTNQVRRKHGVPVLDWERSLNAVARAHSADMLMRGYFSHTNPNGRSPHDRLVSGYQFSLTMSGENIWSGTGHDSRETSLLARIIVDSWMSSPGHRKNLVNPKYSDVGVGVAARGKNIRVTQVFVRHKR